LGWHVGAEPQSVLLLAPLPAAGGGVPEGRGGGYLAGAGVMCQRKAWVPRVPSPKPTTSPLGVMPEAPDLAL